MCVYAIGDHHLGMFSWAEETGADYDCDIAERVLHSSFKGLGARAPRAAKGLILNVGDFFHADNHSSRTPQSGHVLDTDSRHSRVIQTGIRMMKRAIRFALKRHEEVEVINAGGNHDPESAQWLSYALAEAFSGEPRITVRTDPRAYKYLRWGDCLIGVTHGDGCKPAALPMIMATDEREAWGECRHFHFYTGHLHHEVLRKYNSVGVETLPVLPPSDSWHASKGYRSENGMKLDIWHKKLGRRQAIYETVEYNRDA